VRFYAGLRHRVRVSEVTLELPPRGQGGARRGGAGQDVPGAL